jgi:hypothetical protein
LAGLLLRILTWLLARLLLPRILLLLPRVARVGLPRLLLPRILLLLTWVTRLVAGLAWAALA